MPEDAEPELVLVCGMSRSGTTLLATVLDSHPSISMGYELLSPGLPDTITTERLLQDVLARSGGDTAAAIELLRADGEKPVADLVRRSRRALVEVGPLAEIVAALAAGGVTDLGGIPGRTRLAVAIVEAKREMEGTALAGCKLNSPSLEAFLPHLPPARFVFITRDPRDVLASHVANDFGKTTTEVARAWNNYLQRFLAFSEHHAGATHLLRYEDLVGAPDDTVAAIADWLGLDDHRPMLDFVNSKASVHRAGHVNSDQLSRGFFTSSVSRWRSDVGAEDQEHIERECRTIMDELGYEIEMPPPEPRPISDAVMRENRQRLAQKKRFYRDEYQRTIEPWLAGRSVLRMVDAMGAEATRTEAVTYIRHDIDHDIEAALEIGRWENRCGVRSTFCVLHTAWYYGWFDGRTYQHSTQMVETCLELQELGHEINLHNNAVTLGLTTGVDPVDLLRRELDALRRYGLDIRGTSTHGDALCRELGFLNLEIFEETPWELNGGARVVRHGQHEVRLGAVPMGDLGLEYEAYDLPREVYITDSGGRPRLILDSRGRNGLRRAEMAVAPDHGHVVGILTHPIWWDMTRDVGPAATFPTYEQLMQAREERRMARRAARLDARRPDRPG